MSKKKSPASTPVSKHTRSRSADSKVGRSVRNSAYDRKANEIVNTHPSPKRPSSKDSNNS